MRVESANSAPLAASPSSATVAAHALTRTGVLYGIGAYGFWGLVPIYFKSVAHVAAVEVLAHRIVWSVVFLAVLMVLTRGGRAIRAVVRDRRTLLTLCVTTVLIAGNWFGFIWAVSHDQVMQASLGYFINPLVNVLLGFVFLRERLRRWQTLSVLLAAMGVVYLTVAGGQFPAIGLYLAGSFGFYGLLRKTARVESLTGLTVETALLCPLAVGFLAVTVWRGSAAFMAVSPTMNLLLMAAGLITAIPLLWFAAAARRLRLATLGFLQYLAPTGHFLLAVLAYGEPFTHVQVVAFGCIWIALLVYSVDSYMALRRPQVADRPAAPVPPPIE